MPFDKETLISMNPATEEELGRIEVDSTEQIIEKVERAHKAQKSWARLSIEERIKHLEPLEDLLMENCERLSELMTKEQGKPLFMSIGEVKACAKSLKGEFESIEKALQVEEKVNGSDHSKIIYDPLGVVVSITPWNFPILMPHWHIIPAMLAGNAVIIKPSEETTITAIEYLKLIQSLLPEDVLQYVVGDGRQGQELIDQNIQLTVFTGSRDVGSKIMEQSSAQLKRVILELGGKDPLVVLPSADLEAAVSFAVQNSFRNCGQVCVSTERILVHEKVFDEFLAAFKERSEKLKIGNGLDKDVNLGPMIHKKQKEKVLDQVKDAVAKGAEIYFGSLDDDANYVRPIALLKVDEHMEIRDGETFGPVVYIDKFKEPEEAVTSINQSKYGLGAAIFGDEKESMEIARKLETGMVGINRGVSGVKDTPWVGAKQSGFGFHHSAQGHRQFTQTRVITVKKEE